MNAVDAARVLVVVPTLGHRLDYLRQTLASISAQSQRADIVLVAPADAEQSRGLAESHGASVVDDPGNLPSAINTGIAAATDQEFVTWLGDDDLLEPGSLNATVSALASDPPAVLAYGWCRYIDPEGRQLWLNKSGRLAERVLSWGPQLIPQPGMLVRRSAWNAVGGLDESLTMAFDFDLILKLRKHGRLTCVEQPLASFRWHPDSLTVSSRTRNLEESQKVKRRQLSPAQRKVAWTWEGPVRVATRVAARQVSRRARRVADSLPLDGSPA